jgi:hypothetical protein
VGDALGLTEGASPTLGIFRRDERVRSVEAARIEETRRNVERVWIGKRKPDGTPRETVESV